jgi:hypothetical protein
MDRNAHPETPTQGPEPRARATQGGGSSQTNRRPLDGQTAWVLADHDETVLARPLAVELAGQGAVIVAAGPNERKVGEIVGEIAYQGGRARPVFRELSGQLADVFAGCRAAGLADGLGAPGVEPMVLVRALSGRGESLVQTLETELAALLSPLGPGGALLIALSGPVTDSQLDAVASWVRGAARSAARAERRHLVNVVVLRRQDGDADGAARIASTLCVSRSGSLSGQVVVVATK